MDQLQAKLASENIELDYAKPANVRQTDAESMIAENSDVKQNENDAESTSESDEEFFLAPEVGGWLHCIEIIASHSAIRTSKAF